MENKPEDSLHSDILTIPNLLTGLRILLLPVFAILFLKEKYKASLVIFLVGGASDFLDGYMARRLNCRSRLGSYLDPVADHGSVILIYVMLGWGLNIENRLKVDVVMAENMFYTFTNLISGSSHHLTNRITATYSF